MLEQGSPLGQVRGYEPIGRLALIAQFVQALAEPQPQEGIIQIRPAPEGVLYGPAALLPLAQEEITIGDRTQYANRRILLLSRFPQRRPCRLEPAERLRVFSGVGKVIASGEEPLSFVQRVCHCFAFAA